MGIKLKYIYFYMCVYMHVCVCIYMCTRIYSLSGKTPAILNITRTACTIQMSPGSQGEDWNAHV